MRAGMFETETRVCGVCGEEWEALTFWTSTDCGACETATYRARLAEVSASRPYTLDSLGGACPTQAEGRTGDDRPFYFRARHGAWTLSVGEPGDPVDSVYAFDGNRAEGDDPTGGFMEWDDVLPILDAHLTPADERHESTDVMRGIGNGIAGGLVIWSLAALPMAWLAGWF